MIQYISAGLTPSFIAAGIVVVLAIAAAILIPLRWKKANVIEVGVSTIIIAFMVGCIAVGVTSAGADRAAREAFCAEATELYGVDLVNDGDDRCRKLDYPKSEPDKDFEVFGSFELEERTGKGSFTSETIHLVWDEDGFYLATADEGATEYTALDPK